MEEKSKVILVPCTGYEEETVYNALQTGIRALGGIEQFVRPQEKLLVKPNFLFPGEAGGAAVTHPSVIRGVLRILSEAGCAQVKYGDSPARGSCKTAAEKIDLRPENTFGAVLAPMDKEVLTHFEDGITCKDFYFTQDVLEADGIVNLCKMKTHAMQTLTGAVKNTFGLVCGMRKAAMHVKYPSGGEFARMLVDIQRFKTPRLHIMDGITAMEGNGPGNGDPVPMNMLLFSTDPVALDTVFALLVKADPKIIPTNVQGEAMGLGHSDPACIELCVAEIGGDAEVIALEQAVKTYGNGDFKMDRKGGFKMGAATNALAIWAGLSRRPYIVASQCVKCGVCVDHCPVEGGAVTFKKGKDHVPVYNYKKCVRCYCCQEICPQRAIHVKSGL